MYIASCSKRGEPEITVIIERSRTLSWPNDIPRTDTMVLGVQLLGAQGSAITGARVEWRSSNPEVLEIFETPPMGSTPADSLAARLTARVVAHTRGWAMVSAMVDQPGVQAEPLKDSIRVTER